ncbi:MAG: hypothetical protein JSW66_07925, partial [Phycisphaerales bacterium]
MCQVLDQLLAQKARMLPEKNICRNFKMTVEYGCYRRRVKINRQKPKRPPTTGGPLSLFKIWRKPLFLPAAMS